MTPRSPRISRRSRRDPRREPAEGPVEGSVIRPAAAGDIATIITLRSLMFESMGTSSEALLDTHWQQEASRWLQLHLTDPHTCVMVAEAHGTVVSCAMGEVIDLMPSPVRLGPGGLLSNVATFPRHRRLGFTQATVSAVMDWFIQDTDVSVITLNATEEGRAIYERFGFADSPFGEMRVSIERSVLGTDT